MSYDVDLLEISPNNIAIISQSKLTDANNVELKAAFQELALNL